jgi:hypothetical protein
LSPDEAAEAAAGLAPEPPKVEQPQADGPALSEAQAQLESIVTAAGSGFDSFVAVGRELVGDGDQYTGILAWDTFSGFADVPEKAAKFFVKAKAGLVAQLQAKGGKS